MTDVQVYTALRRQALDLTPYDLGLDAPVLAVVMDVITQLRLVEGD